MKFLTHVSHVSRSTVSFAALLAFGLFFCLSPSARAADADLADFKGQAEGANGLKITWQVVAELPGQKKDDEDNQWLVVQPTLNGKELPAIHKESEYLSTQGVPLVYVEDYNFDKHDDLFLVEGMSSHGAYGELLLFTPGSGRFEPSENLTALYTVDKERKQLEEVYHGSACEGGRREYIVKGFDELELVFEEGSECPDTEEMMEKNQYRAFKRSYKDGKLVSEEVEIRTLEE